MYCLFRGAQGNIFAALRLGVMLDGNDFILNSLLCEWGYIINLDDWTLEAWEGFQTWPTEGNRYGVDGTEDGYYPCKLSYSVSLDALDPQKFVAAVRKDN
jgi:hypothetical protein